MIRIVITSDRGEGATTMCMAIVRLLRRFGQNVEYRGLRGHPNEKEIRRRIEDEQPLGLHEAREVVVIDKAASRRA